MVAAQPGDRMTSGTVRLAAAIAARRAFNHIAQISYTRQPVKCLSTVGAQVDLLRNTAASPVLRNMKKCFLFVALFTKHTPAA